MVQLYQCREKELSFFEKQILYTLKNQEKLIPLEENEKVGAIKKIVFFTASCRMVKYSGAYIMKPEENLDDDTTVVLTIEGDEKTKFCVPIRKKDSLYLGIA